MGKSPVKLPLFLAVLAAAVWPFLAVLHVCFYAMDLSGMLSLFFPVAVGIDVLLAALFLLFVWGNVYLLNVLLKKLPNALPAVKRMRVFWKILLVVVCVESFLTPVYSIYPYSEFFSMVWGAVFAVGIVDSLILGVSLAFFGRRGKNGILCGIGLALAVAALSNVNGLRFFQTAMDNARSGVELLDEDVESSMGEFFGLSPSEIDTLDEESLADMQEVYVGAAVLLGSGIFALIALHAVALTLVYVWMAFYFWKKNRESRRRIRSEGEVLC